VSKERPIAPAIHHLVKWLKIFKPIKKGGLGIHDLRKMNLSLLCKWWWKIERGEGLWQEIVKKKYIKLSHVAQLKPKPYISPMWNDLLKVRDLYLRGRIMMVGDGNATDFWNDVWCGEMALKEKYPNLFDICNEQCCLVAEMAQKNWRLSFRRWLDEENQNQWRTLRNTLTTCALTQCQEMPKWRWCKSAVFSVKSMYDHFFLSEIKTPHKKIWRPRFCDTLCFPPFKNH
jgi:hypothetical protein